MEFVKFTPGEYLDFEKDAVQLRLDIAAGKAEIPPMGGPFGKKEPKVDALPVETARNGTLNGSIEHLRCFRKMAGCERDGFPGRGIDSLHHRQELKADGIARENSLEIGAVDNIVLPL